MEENNKLKEQVQVINTKLDAAVAEIEVLKDGTDDELNTQYIKCMDDIRTQEGTIEELSEQNT